MTAFRQQVSIKYQYFARRACGAVAVFAAMAVVGGVVPAHGAESAIAPATMLIGGEMSHPVMEIPAPLEIAAESGKAPDSAPSSPPLEEVTVITVTRSACEAVVEYQPEDDVTYKPGVDVNGMPVAPADLNGESPILQALPKEIEFPVTLDFFENAGIAVPRGIKGEGNLGRISFRNGRVYFNDTPISNSQTSAELVAACREAGFQ